MGTNQYIWSFYETKRVTRALSQFMKQIETRNFWKFNQLEQKLNINNDGNWLTTEHRLQRRLFLFILLVDYF